MKEIPRYLLLNPKQSARVYFDSTISRGAFGSFRVVKPRDEDGHAVVAEIELSSHLSTHAERMHILIHELLHGVAAMLKDAGVTKRQPDEAFVTNAAGPLLFALGANGLLDGVGREEMLTLVGNGDEG